MEEINGWIASLSNGETVRETAPIAGEMSAWQKLLRRLKEEKLQISRMRLQRHGTTVVVVPTADGYVQAYEQTKILFSGRDLLVQGIGSVVGDQVFMNWMNDEGMVWQDVRPLSMLRVHSTLDWQS